MAKNLPFLKKWQLFSVIYVKGFWKLWGKDKRYRWWIYKRRMTYSSLLFGPWDIVWRMPVVRHFKINGKARRGFYLGTRVKVFYGWYWEWTCIKHGWGRILLVGPLCLAFVSPL